MTIWHWKKGIHEPNDVPATMLRRVMDRWNQEKK